MLRRICLALLAIGFGAALWAIGASPARAQEPGPQPDGMNRYFYYPYKYFPHNYWPAMGPMWPEPVGQHYMRPPAYMAYPPFREPHWRYEFWEPQFYYRGSHFWLDQF
jgi:hypothetical protein